MLKFIFKVIVVIILILGISNYANYLITGKTPDISINKSSLPKIDISKLTDSVTDKFESVKKSVTEKSESIKKDGPAENSHLYKWRDADGVIHYASEKPADNTPDIESIEISNDTNVVPSVSAKAKVPVQQQSPQANLPTEIPENLYSPEGVKQLMNQAKDVQNLIDGRVQQLDERVQQ